MFVDTVVQVWISRASVSDQKNFWLILFQFFFEKFS
jgi:hypothetical protein